MKLTKEQTQAVETFLLETGFEIWNAGCTHRLQCSYATNNFRVSDSNLEDPREYKTLQGAINFMTKQDEE